MFLFFSGLGALVGVLDCMVLRFYIQTHSIF